MGVVNNNTRYPGRTVGWDYCSGVLSLCILIRWGGEGKLSGGVGLVFVGGGGGGCVGGWLPIRGCACAIYLGGDIESCSPSRRACRYLKSGGIKCGWVGGWSCCLVFLLVDEEEE